MYKACVLMSTYNGQLYIAEQIESIMNQSDVEVFLKIRDDGSSDETIEIIKRLMEEYPDSISYEMGENLGFANSFGSLLYSAYGYDYYAFSDQDDIWESDKLIKAIEQLMTDKPTLYASNLLAFNMLEEREYFLYTKEEMDEIRDASTQYVFSFNPYGCTMVWNKSLQEEILIRQKPEAMTHDVWVNLVAKCIGQVYLDSKSYIKYRIHGKNACGATPQNIVDRIKKYYKFYFVDKKKLNISLTCRAIVEFFPTKASGTIQRLAVYDKNVINRITALFEVMNLDMHVRKKMKYIMLIIFDKF